MAAPDAMTTHYELVVPITERVLRVQSWPQTRNEDTSKSRVPLEASVGAGEGSVPNSKGIFHSS